MEAPPTVWVLSESGDLEGLKALFEKGSNVNVDETDQYGDTALHIAAAKGRYEVAKFLISKKANVNQKNKTGSTPLHKAALRSEVPVAGLLVTHGADPELKNESGMRPEDLTQNNKLKEILLGKNALTTSVYVAKEKHGLVIGKKGATIEDIKKNSGAIIEVPKPGSNSDQVVIKGRPEAVEKAKELITKLTRKNPEERFAASESDSDATTTEVSLPIPKDKHRYVIGKGGKNLRELEEKLGVRVFVPDQSSEEKNVYVKGPLEAVDQAVKRIYEFVTPEPRGDGEGGRGRGRGRGRGGYTGDFGEDSDSGRGRGRGGRGRGRGRGGFSDDGAEGVAEEGEYNNGGGRGRGRGRGGHSGEAEGEGRGRGGRGRGRGGRGGAQETATGDAQ
eukprot:TRINITY_DN98_c0_g1_i6.p1 TRINITY_DN98_c0_g1~~TRINITY_DN98_c0_g1_i6.p1  ORF type:complete len:390 (-),score=120.83 TRINITY_DN98_c0_g1_i6:815-1984(-)